MSVQPDSDDPAAALHAATAWQEVAAQARLAGPVVVVQVGLFAMGLVDSVIVGHVEHDAATQLAGVALGSLYSWGVLALGMGTLMALDPLVAQAAGARDVDAIGRAVQRGAVLALLLTLPAALALLLARPVLSLLHQPPAVVAIAAAYARWAIPGVPAFFAFVVLRQTLQALHRLRPIVIVIVIANVANALLDWGFVHGRFGLPVLGAVGTSLATTLCRWMMCGMLLAMAWSLVGQHLRPFRREAADRAALLRMLRIGLPIGLMIVSEILAFGTLTVFMGQMGATQMAGHHVALNLAALAYMVPLGISAAASVRVGHAIGRGDAAGTRRAATVSLCAGAGVMCVSALLFVLMPTQLARIFTADAGVLAMAATLLPIASMFQVFDGVQIVAGGVLRGSGDTRTPMIVYMVGYWVFGLPLALWLAFPRGMGPAGLWWGLVAALALVALVLLARVRSRLARPLQRVSVDRAAPTAER
ncbi:MAG TPA: MATE family efflux transporter [Planctomycetota bacterium]|nr:MATE family efflux transporter [Planctomycetota bacterium]